MKTVLLLSLCLLSQSAWATHLLGGSIQVRKTATAQQYTISVILFMDEVNGRPAAQQATTVAVCLGDGSTGQAQLLNRTPLKTDPGVSRYTYTVDHTYPAPSTYTVTCSIIYRTAGIRNMETSVNTPLGLSTTFATNLINSTPLLPGESLFKTGVFQRTVIAFSATDAEGDSLFYSLALPQRGINTSPCTSSLSSVVGYSFPNAVTQRGTFSIDALRGELIWDAPTEIGRYGFALTVYEKRNGVILSQTQYEQVIVAEDRIGGNPGAVPPYKPASVNLGSVVPQPTPESGQVAMTVFPVPTRDQFQVTVTLPEPSLVTLTLIDLNGRVVYTENQQKTAVQQRESLIDVRTLPTGLYVLQAKVGGQTITRKVLKR
ncbi:MAG: T9SS type A sorting domain-containing protein [Bacteroidetes bacterium]|nr:T9SS type A sorting domain-containing protein [Fibrella sp.]